MHAHVLEISRAVAMVPACTRSGFCAQWPWFLHAHVLEISRARYVARWMLAWEEEDDGPYGHFGTVLTRRNTEYTLPAGPEPRGQDWPRPYFNLNILEHFIT